MEERDKKTELLVGLFLTVGLIMLSLLVLQFGSVRDLFKGSYFLSVSFPNASGLKEASPVVLAGKRIGKVKNKPRHNETYTGVIIDLEIFEGEKIPSGSTFTVTTAGLMGTLSLQSTSPKNSLAKLKTASSRVRRPVASAISRALRSASASKLVRCWKMTSSPR
jgi:ABC-type transporter Mla subunit MlaD